MMATLGSQVGQFIERKRAEQAVLSAQIGACARYASGDGWRADGIDRA